MKIRTCSELKIQKRDLDADHRPHLEIDLREMAKYTAGGLILLDILVQRGHPASYDLTMCKIVSRAFHATPGMIL